MTVKQSTAKKIGLFTSLSMLIGSVVGIGIFLKNGNIFKINEFNAIGILVSWILGAIIAFSTAYCFAEIGSSVRSHSGIAGWSEKLVGKKFGYFIKVVFPLFYLSIMEVILPIFLAESIFKVFSANDVHFAWVLLLGFVLMMFFIIFNYFSLKLSGIASAVTTVLKFIPIVAIVISGIVFACVNKTGGLFDHSVGDKIFDDISVGDPKFQLIIASLPSVLFAFDSFTNIGNLALDIKKPERNVSLTIIIGMFLCSVFYILVTLSQIFLMNGNGLSFFGNDFFGNQDVQEGLNITISVFIVFSIFGVVNSFSASIIRSYKSLIDEKIIFNYEFFQSMSNKIPFEDKQGQRPGMILLIVVSCFWWALIGIPSAVLNTDAFADGASNFPTLFFFSIYGILVTSALVNRFTKKTEVTKTKLFFIAAPISIIGISLIFCYLFFYQYLVLPFLLISNVSGQVNPFSWGLFYDGGFTTEPWMASLCFFLAIVFFTIIPFINLWLTKVVNNKKQKKDQ